MKPSPGREFGPVFRFSAAVIVGNATFAVAATLEVHMVQAQIRIADPIPAQAEVRVDPASVR